MEKSNYMIKNPNPKLAATHFSEEYGKGAIKLVKELKFIAKTSHQEWFYSEVLKHLIGQKDKVQTRPKIGDRVEYSEEWMGMYHGNAFKGQSKFTVVGFKGDDLIRVVKDGTKTPTTYHYTFLKPLN